MNKQISGRKQKKLCDDMRMLLRSDAAPERLDGGVISRIMNKGLPSAEYTRNPFENIRKAWDVWEKIMDIYVRDSEESKAAELIYRSVAEMYKWT